MVEDERIFDVAPGEKFEDNRSRIAVFFQVFTRKFWKLISTNLLYLVFNIPSIIISFFLSIYIVNTFSAQMQDDIILLLFVYGFPVMMFLMAVPIISVGPAQAGLTYLLRCFSYEIPTFYWSDFKDKMKENLKQGLIVSLINLAATILLFIDFYVYDQIIRSGGNLLLSISSGLLIIVLVLFLMMSMYIYPMMVTYDLSIKNLYKNAFLFSIGRFLPNIAILLLIFLITIAPILIVLLTASPIVLVITYIYYLLLGFTLPGLIINFFINPILDKYLRKDENKAVEISG